MKAFCYALNATTDHIANPFVFKPCYPLNKNAGTELLKCKKIDRLRKYIIKMINF